MTTLANADTFADLETKGQSAAPYLAGSIFMEGAGSKGAKPRPFNYHLAVRQFHHWAYAAAMLNANAVAGVPLRMYTRRKSGRGVRKNYETRPVSRAAQRYLSGRSAVKPSAGVFAKVVAWGDDIEEVVAPHPLMKVLAGPNGDDNGYELTVDRIIDLQNTGNYWHYVVDNGLSVPAMLLRLPPQWTSVIPNEKRTGDRRVAGYVFGKSTANEVVFSVDEVDHFRMPNPKEGGLYYGMGWVEAGWLSLGLHNAKRVEDTSWKDNQSRPDWMLTVDGGDKDSISRLQSALKERFRGPENAGNFLVANGKWTATALQFEQKELGTPTRLVEEIAAVSGVPVSMLLSNDPNRAGGEGARLQWYRTTIRAYCLRDEQKLNQRYVTRWEGSEDFFVAYDHTSFEDREAVTKEVVALVAGGITSPNEARQELGYQDAEGADFLYPPAGNTGGSAGVLGNLSPQQNDERRDRKTVEKGLARMPSPNTDAERVAFLRQAYLAFLKDGTVADMLANGADFGDLSEAVGMPRNEDYEEPYIPVVSDTGPVVDGTVLRDDEQDVVGGGPGLPPVEVVQVNKDTANGPDLAQD